MIPSSSPSSLPLGPWLWLIAAALTGGCTASHPPRFESAAALPDEPRKPDGIAVDLTSEPPATRDGAQSEDELVTLRAPLSIDAAHETVREFFSAVVDASLDGLNELLAEDAIWQQDTTGKRSEHSPELRSVWSERFKKHDYKPLRLADVYRPSDVRTYRGNQQAALPIVARESTGSQDEEVRTTDIILHVPITTHTIKNERLLANEMYFWLRRSPCTGSRCKPPGEIYKIYRVLEVEPP